MRAVIYDDETFEPLTVVDLPRWAVDMLEEGRIVRFYVMRPHKVRSYNVPDENPTIEHDTVALRFERIYWHGRPHWLAVTHTPETALLMRSTLLAGQHAAVQDRERAAFQRGLLEALGAA